MPTPSAADFANYAAFNCPLHAGILILDAGEDHYCTDCGHPLRKVAPLHPLTVDALAAGDAAARTLGVVR